MAALTFFITASLSGKRFSLEQLESFIRDLLHERHVLLPVALFVGEARNEVRGSAFDAAGEDGTLLHSFFLYTIFPDRRKTSRSRKQSAQTTA